MNKHAYLIIAHNEPEVLRTLLAMLDDVRNDIFVHIDRRARSVYESIKDYKAEHSALIFLEHPIAVYWGDISQVQVEYMLFKTISTLSFRKTKERSSSAFGRMRLIGATCIGKCIGITSLPVISREAMRWCTVYVPCPGISFWLCRRQPVTSGIKEALFFRKAFNG